jgi:hypothetical protein
MPETHRWKVGKTELVERPVLAGLRRSYVNVDENTTSAKRTACEQLPSALSPQTGRQPDFIDQLLNCKRPAAYGARSKVLAAAEELYGVGSREAKAVQCAYAVIKVGADIAE